MAMNGDECEAAFLIEVQRMEIIIRCDQPEPLAACFLCRLRDCLDQQCAYPDPRLGAIERHDLAALIFKSVRQQSHPLPFQDGDEAGQRLGMIDLARILLLRLDSMTTAVTSCTRDDWSDHHYVHLLQEKS